MNVLKDLAHASDNFGFIKGPWAVGKTKVDIVVTLLLMSLNKKVKILSPTNMAADTFILQLNAELARLKESEIEITEKYVVRFQLPLTYDGTRRYPSRNSEICESRCCDYFTTHINQ